MKYFNLVWNFSEASTTRTDEQINVYVDQFNPEFKTVAFRDLCPLYIAIINGDLDSVKHYVRYVDPSSKYNAPIHPKFPEGRNWTYLVYALYTNCLPVVNFLLEDIRVVRAVYKEDYQPLRWCIERADWINRLPLILDVLPLDLNLPSDFSIKRIIECIDTTIRYNKESPAIKMLLQRRSKLPEWLSTVIESFIKQKTQ